MTSLNCPKQKRSKRDSQAPQHRSRGLPSLSHFFLTRGFPTRLVHCWAHGRRKSVEAEPNNSIPCGAALDLIGHLQGLKISGDNPEIPLDKNLAERELRGVVLGRKNHYGSRSKRGTEVTALYYSLLETAKLGGEEPSAYLLRATRAALDSPGTVTLPVAPGT